MIPFPVRRCRAKRTPRRETTMQFCLTRARLDCSPNEFPRARAVARSLPPMPPPIACPHLQHGTSTKAESDYLIDAVRETMLGRRGGTSRGTTFAPGRDDHPGESRRSSRDDPLGQKRPRQASTCLSETYPWIAHPENAICPLPSVYNDYNDRVIRR